MKHPVRRNEDNASRSQSLRKAILFVAALTAVALGFYFLRTPKSAVTKGAPAASNAVSALSPGVGTFSKHFAPDKLQEIRDLFGAASVRTALPL
jgi:hypothetical protein